MSFQRYVVREEDEKPLDALYEIAKKNPLVYEAIRTEFKGLLVQLNVKIEPFQLSRLLSKPSDSKYEFLLLLYHYTMDTLRFELKYMESKFRSPTQFDLIHEKFAELVAAAKDRKPGTLDEGPDRGDSIQNSLGEDKPTRDESAEEGSKPHETVQIEHPPLWDGYMDEIPATFYGEYFGYRWSTSGDVIRFYVRISPYPGDLRRTYFRNEYVRGNDTWIIDGSGLYTKRALYLYGYAESEDRTTHFGLRLSVLRPFAANNDDILCGLLLSMNFDEPIASRILFVRLSKHLKSKKQEKLSARGYIDQMIGKGKQDSFDIETEILPPISRALQEIRRYDGEKSDVGVFFQLLRNSSPNVLRMKPDWSSKEKFKLEKELARAELRLRKLKAMKRYKDLTDEHIWLDAFNDYLNNNEPQAQEEQEEEASIE